MKREHVQRSAKARREGALARVELRTESIDRTSAEGPTSFAVKARDPGLQADVEAFLARRERGDK